MSCTEERTSALNEFPHQTNPWSPLNSLFSKYISYYEDVCNQGGVRVNPSYYVKRKNNYEYDYSERICTLSNNKANKITILTGHIGKGKTTFLQYLEKSIIPMEYKNVICVYIDLTAMYEDNSNNLVKKRILRTFESIFQKKFFSSKYDLQKSYIDYQGFPDIKPQAIPKVYKENIDLYSFIQFVDTIPNIANHKILLFIDNLDENSRRIIKKFKYFILALNSFFRENTDNLSSTIVITIRDYNTEFFNQSFSQTNLNVVEELPPVSPIEVVKAKFEEISDVTKKYTQQYSQEVDFAPNYLHSKIVITNDKVNLFLRDLVDIIFEENSSPLFNVIEELSSNNLKILVSNILNLLQSKNLPLTELFEYHFNPNKTDGNKPKLTKFNIINCLIAVKYPYYDKNSSHIINVFDINGSKNCNDFHNILMTVRFLFYILYHCKNSVTLETIYREFNKYNYPQQYLEILIDKCFGAGLLETKYGMRISHLEKRYSKICLSSAGIFYLKQLIPNISYLQYISEDTWMEPKYIIPILNKYEYKQISSDRKRNRIDSCKLLIDFIRLQEDKEIKFIKNLGFKEEDYLEKFSYHENGKGIRLGEFLKKQFERARNKIERRMN